VDRIEALRLFVRLAERGSFSAAAKDLKIKQSTASKWVAALESELGTSLLQRTTRSVHVTEAGRRLLVGARGVLAAFDEMKEEVDEARPELSGRVRVSIPVVFGRVFLVPVVAEFLERHPMVHVELVFNDRYVNLVEEGFDLAVRVGVPADTSARGRKLADSRRVLVASPVYLRARPRPAVPRDLREHECLVHGDASQPTIWRFGRGSGPDQPMPVHGRVAANNSEAVLCMARRGLGVALLADWLVEADLKRGRLVPLLEEFTTPPAPIYVLSPPGRFPSSTARALIEHVAVALTPRLAAPV
jgi:DNA-binding transcriptional LysR family regulator